MTEKQTAASNIPESARKADNNPQDDNLGKEKHVPSPDIDARDTIDEEWSLENHLRAIVKDLRDHGLPQMSSGSSIAWKDLVVRGAGAGVIYQSSVGQVIRGPLTAIRKLARRGKPPERTILHNVEGVVREGEMLLILGRPGSGCSTLLKSLCGLTDEYLGWQGDVKYNGVDVDTFKKRFRGDAVYTPEVDTHFPHLRVGNTLDFASETKVPRLRPAGETAKDFVKARSDLWATSLGLRHILQTKVGNDFVRGISGGERKRISLSETLATRASVTYWDNPTRGLDASTSLDFIRILRQLTTITRNTAMVALYQAGENLTQEFDKVTVLYLGRQIFFGLAKDAKPYFEELGYFCKPSQTTADFLTAITDPYARRVRKGWEYQAPRTPGEFVKAWKKSTRYCQLQEEMKQYDREFSQPKAHLEEYQRYQSSQKAKYQRKENIYMTNIGMQVIANFKRAIHRLLGDKAFLGASGLSSLFMAIIMGSMFYNTPNTTSGFFSRGGVLFFAVLFNAVQTMTEIGTQYAQRPIVQRQGIYAMYHPFVDSISTMVAEYPYKLLTVTAFDIVLYFMANLKREPGAFFIFWITTFLTTIAMSAHFRTIAAATKSLEVAVAIGGISVLASVVYTGYVIPKPTMHPWFKWITYVQPLSFAFETLMANEFHDARAFCTNLVPSGPGFENTLSSVQACAVTGSKPGQSFVNGDDYIGASFGYHYSHVGRNIGIICIFIVGFAVTFALATEYNSLARNQGKFLIFRRDHEPESVKKALQDGKVIDDIESQDDFEPLTDVRSKASEIRGLVKSKDIFTWEQLNYDILTTGGETRRLLSEVSGYVRPGTLTALMGESGAGKTTLLNVLAQRVNVGVVSGHISVNGALPGRSFQRRTGYVQQQDVHLAESTVREALRFSATLRQPKDVPLEEKYAYVESVIEILEMKDYAEAVIGLPGSGLNVEQRKRTTIGVELVAKPALLLFLDEPTSGLDSQSAWSVVRFLRKLADSGQAILCTIHQPSSVLFEQFDRLLLLKKGGKTVYFGDIGPQSRKVIDYFESTGAFQCTPDANPAEYILDVIGAGATAHVYRDYNEVWTQSAQYKEAIQELQTLKSEYAGEDSEGQIDTSFETEFAVSWFSQYRAVQSRLYLHYWRNPSYVMGKVMLNVVSGLFIGFTFYKEKDTAQGLQNKVFAAFMVLLLAFALMNQLQPRFHELAQVYLVREKPSKMYHFTAFVLSAHLVEIPYNLVAGTLFFLPWFTAVNFYHDWPSSANSAARGVYLWLVVMFFEMWISTFGQAVAALAPDPETAAALTTLFTSFVSLFSGVFQPVRQLITFWHWMYRASPYTYLVGGLITTALHGVPVNCAPNEISHFSPPSNQTCGEYAGSFAARTGNLLNPNATSDCHFCRYKDSDEYLVSLTLSYGDRWRNIGFLAVYVLFNMMLAFLFFYLTKVSSWNFRRFKLFKSKKI